MARSDMDIPKMLTVAEVTRLAFPPEKVAEPLFKPTIVHLRTEQQDVAESALRLAEEIVMHARSGECKGLAVVLIMADGSTWTRATGSTNRQSVLTGILDLLFDYQMSRPSRDTTGPNAA